jgi:hypothetical protein
MNSQLLQQLHTRIASLTIRMFRNLHHWMEAIFQMWKEPKGGGVVFKVKRAYSTWSPFKALGSSLNPFTYTPCSLAKKVHLFMASSKLAQAMIFFFIFLMLHHWLASQEGFSIKCWQVYRTCLHSIKKAT